MSIGKIPLRTAFSMGCPIYSIKGPTGEPLQLLAKGFNPNPAQGRIELTQHLFRPDYPADSRGLDLSKYYDQQISMAVKELAGYARDSFDLNTILNRDFTLENNSELAMRQLGGDQSFGLETLHLSYALLTQTGELTYLNMLLNGGKFGPDVIGWKNLGMIAMVPAALDMVQWVKKAKGESRPFLQGDKLDEQIILGVQDLKENGELSDKDAELESEKNLSYEEEVALLEADQNLAMLQTTTLINGAIGLVTSLPALSSYLGIEYSAGMFDANFKEFAKDLFAENYSVLKKDVLVASGPNNSVVARHKNPDAFGGYYYLLPLSGEHYLALATNIDMSGDVRKIIDPEGQRNQGRMVKLINDSAVDGAREIKYLIGEDKLHNLYSVANNFIYQVLGIGKRPKLSLDFQ
ncbi:hypothetical protein BVY03_05150 [bacterium K02(2017)]|nr:hypothetical protein BVY03_05150 [bacterium K02(2017)]